MYSEEDLLPLSALQHLVFCERQCALIHLEQQWAENRLTAEGRLLHQVADETRMETRDGIPVWRGLRIRGLHLGLSGRADAVEFRPQPYPVEYKRGHEKPDDCDEVQLCAQGLCLEEMLGVSVGAGALFYGQPRRRLDVQFDTNLRTRTIELAAALHALINSGQTPSAAYGPKCRRCSLVDICRPKAARSAVRYVARAIASILQSEGGSHEAPAEHPVRDDAG